MKRIICVTLLVLSFAANAFSAATVASTAGAMTVKGGADAVAAAGAPTPLIKFSTGVFGQVNFTAVAASKTSAGYLIGARHSTGSKNFGTDNARSNIYWKQVSAGADTAARLLADLGAADETGTTFATGWTSY